MSAPMLEGLRFLVVEDNELNACLCQEQLLLHGAREVRLADSVATAMAELDAGRFDAVIVDFQLRDEDATAIMDRLDEMRVPRVLVTGGTFDPIPRRFAHLRVLPKPYTCEALLHAVAAAMQRLLDADIAVARRIRRGSARLPPRRGGALSAANDDLSEAAE